MPRDEGLSLNEREFILKALGEGVRLDGRRFDQFRQLRVEFGDEYGVADVRLGKTRILARVSCEVTNPFPDRKFDGIFQISTEFSPMASPAFEVGRQTTTEVMLSRLLEKAIRRSSALDTESLCIIAGRKCFSVRADLHILDHDGGLVDTACIAAIAALRHFRRPDVEVQGEDVHIFTPAEREPIPLSILHHPLCVTFSVFEVEDKNTQTREPVTLLDATAAEEQVRDADVVVSANRHGEICQVAKYGGGAVDALSLLEYADQAVRQVKILDDNVKAALEKDATRRDVGGLMAELQAENERPMEPPVG